MLCHPFYLLSEHCVALKLLAVELMMDKLTLDNYITAPRGEMTTPRNQTGH